MSAETAGSDSLIGAARVRRAQLTQRVAMACMICLAFSQVIGWSIPAAWLVVYAIAQAMETGALSPLYLEDAVEPKPWRAGLGLAAILFNSATFGALSIALWAAGGAYGGVCASLLLAAAMINAVVSSPGSQRVLFCAVAPQLVYLLASVAFMRATHVPMKFQFATGVGAVAFGIYAVMLWHNLEKRRVAEEAVRAESARRQAEAEAATAAKSIYVAMIGHELRTPISAMLAGAIELERAAKGSALRPHASLIADAGRMMKSLLDDVLDHAKLEAGRMSVETVTFDLRSLLAQTARFWQSEARKKKVRLRITGAAHVPAWVAGDPTRLRQVLNNLISNAVKFTDTGSVTLSLSSWASEDDACAVRIQVVDTGSGMEPEQLGRLFSAFQQADKSVARNYGGTGLGLVISRQLARLMGGQLTVASRKGEGSTFTLALTLDTAEAPPIPITAVELERAPSAGGRAIRILVADDHEINRRAVQLVLQPMGVEITTVCDGKAAVAAAEAEAFDLIVMDVRMPEMDGRTASRRIRDTDGPNRDIPIVAVTADTDKDDIEACRAAGMDWFVGKPIDPAKLVQSVMQALEAGRASDQDAASEAAEEEDAGDRPVRVLVADDHEINRRAVQLVLEPAGALVTTVADGLQAFEAAQREAFDVIVMDVRMPEMDGQESTRRIRATPGPNQNTPIIAVTAEVDSRACFEAGMNFFVPKPIDAQKLMAAVVEALQAASGGEEGQDEAGDAPGDRAVA